MAPCWRRIAVSTSMSGRAPDIRTLITPGARPSCPVTAGRRARGQGRGRRQPAPGRRRGDRSTRQGRCAICAHMGPETKRQRLPRADDSGETAAQRAEARGFEPRKGANPNRISSSDRGRPDRFKLDQLLRLDLPGWRCTAVNCNPNCNPSPRPTAFKVALGYLPTS